MENNVKTTSRIPFFKPTKELAKKIRDYLFAKYTADDKSLSITDTGKVKTMNYYANEMRKLEAALINKDRIAKELYKGEEVLIGDLIKSEFFSIEKARFKENLINDVWNILDRDLNIHTITLAEMRATFYLADLLIGSHKHRYKIKWYVRPLDTQVVG